MEELPMGSGTKLILFENLVVFMTYNKNIIKANQICVMEAFTNSSYKNIILLLNQENELEELKKFVDQILETASNKEIITEIEVPYRIEYFCQQFIFFSVATEDINFITEIKCQTLFPLKLIFYKYYKN